MDRPLLPFPVMGLPMDEYLHYHFHVIGSDSITYPAFAATNKLHND